MKILFLASKPASASALSLEAEIMELQICCSEASGEPVSFVFLPSLKAEDLPGFVARHQPDVLHISCHGETDYLSLANSAGDAVPLDASALAAFLPPERPPRVIYLNACNSGAIAKELSKHVAVAIGTNAPITNRAARAGAVAFYQRLLRGMSIQEAFNASQNMIAMLQAKNAASELYYGLGVFPQKEVLHRVPRLIAKFADDDPKPQKNGDYTVRFGLVGCPANAKQIIFFTDDESFIDAEEDSLEADLSIVWRGSPTQNIAWIGEEEGWRIIGDFRLFATGVTGDGQTFSVGSTLCDAMETRYRLTGNGEIPRLAASAIAELRRENGTELEHTSKRQGPTKRKRSVPAGKVPEMPNALKSTAGLRGADSK